MSSVHPRVTANTPFIEGLPNSIVTREWYRLIMSMVNLLGNGQQVTSIDVFQADTTTQRAPLDSAINYFFMLERLTLIESTVLRLVQSLKNNLFNRASDIECLLVMHRPPPLPASPLVSISSFIDAETPAGTIDGANATFTLANTPLSGSVHLYLNGLRQRPTTDFSVSGKTITYTAGAKPNSGDNHVADYRQ